MTDTRFSRMQKAMALVPLALLSTAWTANMVGVGGGAAVATVAEEHSLPDGTTVPTDAIEDPASFTTPGSLGLGVPAGSTAGMVKTASTTGIPSAALSAYQRAATVINKADKGCQIPWQLVAAIGRVESDHGRYGGNSLGKDGVSRPGIYGIALDGSNKTQAISDTDAGQYDNDVKFDRAVGPMQFIPSTWSVVGVDADGDSKRNPQDIDDSALAAAVYLCSGNDDLSAEPGQRAAVHRYNHSTSYVDLVLDITNAYLQGDFTSVPNNTTSAVTFNPDYDYTSPKNTRTTGSTPSNNPDLATDKAGPTTGSTPSDDPTQDPGNDEGSGDGDGGDTTPDKPPKTANPIEKGANDAKKAIEKGAKDLGNGVKEGLTRTQALAQCTISNPLNVLKCVNDLLSP